MGLPVVFFLTFFYGYSWLVTPVIFIILLFLISFMNVTFLKVQIPTDNHRKVTKTLKKNILFQTIF